MVKLRLKKYNWNAWRVLSNQQLKNHTQVKKLVFLFPKLWKKRPYREGFSCSSILTKFYCFFFFTLHRIWNALRVPLPHKNLEKNCKEYWRSHSPHACPWLYTLPSRLGFIAILSYLASKSLPKDYKNSKQSCQINRKKKEIKTEKLYQKNFTVCQLKQELILKLLDMSLKSRSHVILAYRNQVKRWP